MATIYTREKRKQQIMILIFLVIVLATVLIWWGGFFKEINFGIRPDPVVMSPPLRDIKIDFGVLESEFLKEARPFEIIEPVENFGRENPFLSL